MNLKEILLMSTEAANSYLTKVAKQKGLAAITEKTTANVLLNTSVHHKKGSEQVSKETTKTYAFQTESSNPLDYETLIETELNKKRVALANMTRSNRKTARMSGIKIAIVNYWDSKSRLHKMSIKDARSKFRIHCEGIDELEMIKSSHRDIKNATQELAADGVLPEKFKV
jgi:hypothetical protein